jgi:hypothetical protein
MQIAGVDRLNDFNPDRVQKFHCSEIYAKASVIAYQDNQKVILRPSFGGIFRFVGGAAGTLLLNRTTGLNLCCFFAE